MRRPLGSRRRAALVVVTGVVLLGLLTGVAMAVDVDDCGEWSGGDIYTVNGDLAPSDSDDWCIYIEDTSDGPDVNLFGNDHTISNARTALNVNLWSTDRSTNVYDLTVANSSVGVRVEGSFNQGTLDSVTFLNTATDLQTNTETSVTGGTFDVADWQFEADVTLSDAEVSTTGILTETPPGWNWTGSRLDVLSLGSTSPDYVDEVTFGYEDGVYAAEDLSLWVRHTDGSWENLDDASGPSGIWYDGSGHILGEDDLSTDREATLVLLERLTVDSCGATLTEPGIYDVTSDLSTGGGPCITVASDDVTVAGGGHTVAGDPAVQVADGHTGVSIESVQVEGGLSVGEGSLADVDATLADDSVTVDVTTSVGEATLQAVSPSETPGAAWKPVTDGVRIDPGDDPTVEDLRIAYSTGDLSSGVEDGDLDVWRHDGVNWTTDYDTAVDPGTWVGIDGSLTGLDGGARTVAAFGADIETSSPAVTVSAGGSGTLTVTATESDGTPIEGVEVAVADAGGLGDLSAGETATTDADGQAAFAFSETDVGDYDVAVGLERHDLETTTTVTVEPGPPHRLAVDGQPPNVTAGETMDPPVSVSVLDAHDNVVTDFGDTVTVALASGNASLEGTTAVAAVDGVATFGTLTVESVGEYTLTADAAPVTAVDSDSFSVSPAAPAEVTARPTSANTTVSERYGPHGVSFEVSVADDYGNPVPGVDLAVEDDGTSVQVVDGRTQATGPDGNTSVRVYSPLAQRSVGFTFVEQSSGTEAAAKATVTFEHDSVSRFDVFDEATRRGTTGTVAVHATDHLGNPVPDLPVAVRDADGLQSLAGATATTNDTGWTTLSFAGRDPGSHDVVVTADGGRASNTSAVTVTAGHPVEQCRTIDRPGAYTVVGAVGPTGGCILITADDVHLGSRGGKIGGAGDSFGVRVANAANVTLEGLEVETVRQGVRLDNATGAVLRDVRVRDAGQSGIVITGVATGTRLESVTVSNSGRDNLRLSSIRGTTESPLVIREGRFTDGGDAGVDSRTSRNVRLIDTVVRGTEGAGIRLEDPGGGFQVRGGSVTDTGGPAVSIQGSEPVSVSGVTVTEGTEAGVVSLTGRNVTLDPVDTPPAAGSRRSLEPVLRVEVTGDPGTIHLGLRYPPPLLTTLRLSPPEIATYDATNGQWTSASSPSLAWRGRQLRFALAENATVGVLLDEDQSPVTISGPPPAAPGGDQSRQGDCDEASDWTVLPVEGESAVSGVGLHGVCPTGPVTVRAVEGNASLESSLDRLAGPGRVVTPLVSLRPPATESDGSTPHLRISLAAEAVDSLDDLRLYRHASGETWQPVPTTVNETAAGTIEVRADLERLSPLALASVERGGTPGPTSEAASTTAGTPSPTTATVDTTATTDREPTTSPTGGSGPGYTVAIGLLAVLCLAAVAAGKARSRRR